MSRQAKTSSHADPPLQVGDYRLEKVIGQGTYGKVRLGAHIETGENAAIKVIEKAQIQSPKQIARLQREIRFLKLLNHPNIVKVLDVIETHDFIYIIMEYAVGGELFDYIVANKRVKEKEARSFFRMVLSAVDYCHQNAIIHRDLKPENLLLDDKKNIKIIDFGFGNNFSHNGLLDTFCGSPFYAAPEMILGKKYEGPEVDMWSLGVILFALLCGHLPFDDDNMKELYKKIANGIYKAPDYLPAGARHLIGRLITVDPKKRATLKEVLKHPWVNEGYEGPPPSHIPNRPVLNDPASLSKDITNRLEIFGYSKESIDEAFLANEDLSKPNAIRATYHLLSEMVIREQARLRALRRSQQQKMTERKMANSFNTLTSSDQPSSQVSLSHEKDQADPMTSSTTIESSNQNSLNYNNAPQPQPNAAGFNTRSLMMDQKRVPQQPSRAGSYYHQQQNQGQKEGVFGSVKNIDGASSARSVSYSTSRGNSNVDYFGHSSIRESVTTQRPSTVSINNNGSNNLNRRQSVPLMIPDPTAKVPTTTEKLKQELKAVSGWFLNFSTTSSKTQDELLGQFNSLLGDQAVSWTTDGRSMFQCQVDLNKLEHANVFAPVSKVFSDKAPTFVTIQVEIARIPRTPMNAIHFKRIHGGVWNYKKACNKILACLSL